MPELERCDACRGKGSVKVSQWFDQYGRTRASYDRCPGCGDCPEAIVQWASFGEREDNYFQRLHRSDKGIAERSSDPARGRGDD